MNEVRKFMREAYGAPLLLDVLPPHDNLKWIPWSVNPGVDLPEALIIGTVDLRDILAFVTQKGDKPREVRYCSIPKGHASSSGNIQMLTQDDVVLMDVNAPFKYNADPAKGMKRKFSVIIKWYFMARGLLDNAVSGDLSDWCKIFYNALRNIEPERKAQRERNSGAIKPAVARKSAYGKSSERVRSPSAHTRVEESPDVADPSSPYGLRSSHRDKNGDTTAGAPNSPDFREEPHAVDAGEFKRDYDTLCKYLETQNKAYLLENMPDASELQFFDGKLSPTSIPKKLFIGRTNENRDNIYAHVRRSVDGNKAYSVDFWSRDMKSSGELKWKLDNIAKQNIIHPFNKTYPKQTALTYGDEVRIDTLIKWYFMAAGVAKDTLWLEKDKFASDLVSTLEFIATRMGHAAVPNPHVRPAPPKQTPTPRALDESHIQNTLASASSRGTKRTAEDAAFDAIFEVANQERSLTTEINAVDAELETLEMKKQNFREHMDIEKQRYLDQLELKSQNFVDQWEMEHDRVLGKRRSIAEKRKVVRMKVRRLTREVGEEE
jgi:hypothetical protein